MHAAIKLLAEALLTALNADYGDRYPETRALKNALEAWLKLS